MFLTSIWEWLWNIVGDINVHVNNELIFKNSHPNVVEYLTDITNDDEIRYYYSNGVKYVLTFPEIVKYDAFLIALVAESSCHVGNDDLLYEVSANFFNVGHHPKVRKTRTGKLLLLGYVESTYTHNYVHEASGEIFSSGYPSLTREEVNDISHVGNQQKSAKSAITE